MATTDCKIGREQSSFAKLACTMSCMWNRAQWYARSSNNESFLLPQSFFWIEWTFSHLHCLSLYFLALRGVRYSCLSLYFFQTLALSVKVCIHRRSSQCITDYTMWQHTSDPFPTLYKQSHCSSLGMPRVCFSLQGCVKHCSFESEFVMINVQSVLVANQTYLLNSLHSLIFIKPDYT